MVGTPNIYVPRGRSWNRARDIIEGAGNERWLHQKELYFFQRRLFINATRAPARVVSDAPREACCPVRGPRVISPERALWCVRSGNWVGPSSFCGQATSVFCSTKRFSLGVIIACLRRQDSTPLAVNEYHIERRVKSGSPGGELRIIPACSVGSFGQDWKPPE